LSKKSGNSISVDQQPSRVSVVGSTGPNWAFGHRAAAHSGLFPASPTKHTDELSWPQSRLGHRLGRLTTFRPRPFGPYVVVSDQLFIASHHAFQKPVDFVAIQKRFACVNTVKDVLCVNSCRTHTSSFLVTPNFFKWFITARWLMPSSWPMLRLLRCRSLPPIQRFYRKFRRQAFRSVAHLGPPWHQNENLEAIVVRWKWKLYCFH